MAVLISDAIVLHAFDYLESSRIVRLITRDAGIRSALAKGARRSQRRFGSGLDLFAQGSAHLYSKAGRELDTLSAFEDVRSRTGLGDDLARFAGAEAIAEIALRLGSDGADEALFVAVADGLDQLAAAAPDTAATATLACAWSIVAALGSTPSLEECAECASALESGDAALFSHAAGGALCGRCAPLAAGGRKLPGPARAMIARWIRGEPSDGGALPLADVRAHQRLLREYLAWHLHDGRPLRALEIWESADWAGSSPGSRATPADTSGTTSDAGAEVAAGAGGDTAA